MLVQHVEGQVVGLVRWVRRLAVESLSNWAVVADVTGHFQCGGASRTMEQPSVQAASMTLSLSWSRDLARLERPAEEPAPRKRQRWVFHA